MKKLKADVIIGAGYGDEGKGYFTDYISSQKEKSVVIRFNGGAQAGHTVITPKGEKHVFGHFTSNLFLKDSCAYLAKYFLINPIIFLKELNQLQSLGIKPVIACHSKCYMTTPFDMLINQWLEYSRGEKRHGSCGLGIGETIERSETNNYPIYMEDTKNPIVLKEKLQGAKVLFLKRIKELKLDSMLEKFKFVLSEDFMDKFLNDVFDMNEVLDVGVDNIKHSFFENKSIVFEGAQGLMLDQSMGEFPYVTRSNTGLKNVIDFSIENGIKELNVIYVTRSYKTRHGAGPLKWEMENKPYENVIDHTNIENEYQGVLRFAYLDFNVLKETIFKDVKSIKKELVKNKIKLVFSLGVTWLNVTENHNFYCNDKLLKKDTQGFIHDMQQFLKIKVIESYGKTRDYVKN